MLKVTFYAGGIQIQGHAFFNPDGNDIVCAAISGIVLGGLNWFDKSNVQVRYEHKKELFSFELLNSDWENLVALQVIQTQIQAIAKVYPAFVSVDNNYRKIDLM